MSIYTQLEKLQATVKDFASVIGHHLGELYAKLPWIKTRNRINGLETLVKHYRSKLNTKLDNLQASVDGFHVEHDELSEELEKITESNFATEYDVDKAIDSREHVTEYDLEEAIEKLDIGDEVDDWFINNDTKLAELIKEEVVKFVRSSVESYAENY